MRCLNANVKLNLMSDDHEQIAVVAKRIVRYLRIHPEAADTVRGIARWWLRRYEYEETDEMVEKALEQLLREGVVIQTMSRNGNIIYRRRRTVVPHRRSREAETLH